MKHLRKYLHALCFLLAGLLLIQPVLSLQAQVLLLPPLDNSSVSTAPGDSVSDGDSVSEYSVITGFENMELLTNLPKLRLVQRTSPHDINDLLEHVFPYYRIKANVQHSDGSTETITLTVNWDCFGYDVFRVDVTTPGSYTEIGRIQLPNDQTVFGEGVPSQLTIPVTVYVPDTPVEITYIQDLDEDFLFYSSYALEQYHDVSEVTDLLRDTWVCEDANGHEYQCPVSLDTSLVDTDTPGLYEISGTFLPPLHCTFPEGLEVPTFTLELSVQAYGQPKIDCMQPSVWFLYFPWIARDMDLDSMKVWLSENDGEWRELCLYDEVYLTEWDLSLDTYFLTEGSSYRLQVDYEGGQTGIASFDYDEGIFRFKDYVDGDRDGGDTNGNPPIILPTPAPTTAPTATPTAMPTQAPTTAPTQTPAVVPTAVPEAAPTTVPVTPTSVPEAAPTTIPVTPTSAPEAAPTELPAAVPTSEPATPPTQLPASEPTALPDEVTTAAPTSVPAVTPTEAPASAPTAAPIVISTPEPTATPVPPSLRPEPYLLGSEVLQMVENTGFARFSNEEILLSLDADTVRALELKDDEQLLVTLLPLGTDGFSLDIKRNGEPLTTLEHMQVTLPYTTRDASSHLVLVDNQGTEVTKSNLSEDSGLVTFTLHQTGIFSIQEHTASQASSSTEIATNSFPWPAVIISLLLLVLVVILLIIHAKRGKNNV